MLLLESLSNAHQGFPAWARALRSLYAVLATVRRALRHPNPCIHDLEKDQSHESKPKCILSNHPHSWPVAESPHSATLHPTSVTGSLEPKMGYLSKPIQNKLEERFLIEDRYMLQNGNDNVRMVSIVITCTGHYQSKLSSSSKITKRKVLRLTFQVGKTIRFRF